MSSTKIERCPCRWCTNETLEFDDIVALATKMAQSSGGFDSSIEMHVLAREVLRLHGKSTPEKKKEKP